MRRRGRHRSVVERAKAGTAAGRVAACPTFDLSDADAEWATEYISFPPSRAHYLPLRDLGIEVSGDWRETLEAVAAAVRPLQPEAFGAVQGVAVGYDDGDLTAWTR